MDVKKQLPLKGKRHEFVRFIASLIPTLQINTDGQIQLEFGVVDFLVEKVQKVVAKKKEKKEQQERELKPQDSTREGEEPEEPKPHDSTSEGEEQEELKPHDSIREDEAKQEVLESSAAGREDEGKQEEPESDDAAKKDERKQEEPELGGEAGEDEGKQEEPELSGAAREDEGEQETPKSNGAANEEINQENEHDKYSRKAEDQQLDESLEDTVQRSKPHTTWDDVAGLQNAKWQLQIAAEMPEKQPALFMGKRKAPQFILLYGPPGTGKGHLAKALSNSVDSTLFIVSASDITSMWHGQSER
jgi:SpoVK/Ycf46/Vps4 family AAA+-type ATPase